MSSSTSDTRSYSAAAILRDGHSIRIRAIRPDDKDRLSQFVERMSPQSAYFRFFRTKKRLTDGELKAFTELDFQSHVALVATLGVDEDERIVGVGRYALRPGAGDPPGRAELAFAVADDHQGLGIGTLLLEHLAAIARSQGITRFEADVLGENNRMLQMFASSGFAIERAFESGVFHVSFPTERTQRQLVASLEREMQAAAKSVAAILNPASVAVVGVSRKPGTIGRALDGYRGAPPGDREALVRVIQRVSALVEALPEIVEMDLNPVKVLEPGRGAIVVDARIRVAREGTGRIGA